VGAILGSFASRFIEIRSSIEATRIVNSEQPSLSRALKQPFKGVDARQNADQVNVARVRNETDDRPENAACVPWKVLEVGRWEGRG